jgi:hypothetical protein
MTFGTARDLSSQVVAIPMTSFGMLMNSSHSEFQRMCPPSAFVSIEFSSSGIVGYSKIGRLLKHRFDL